MKNKGYSMVELIIVIAIMLVLSGMSFVTIGIIRQARIQDGYTTLSNQMGALMVKTKAVSEVKKEKLALKLHYADDEEMYGVKKVRKGSYVLLLGTVSDSGSFTAIDSDTYEGLISNVIEDIQYTETNGSAVSVKDGDIIIQYNKSNGSVELGDGSYELICDDEVVGTVLLDKATGSHRIK